MTIYTPYTYFIKWSKTGMKYYGVRFAQNCHPSEFWIDYFTSSNYVSDYVKEHGEPDIKIIRKKFVDSTKARLWEHRVLKRLKVTSREDYLNKSDGKAIDTSVPEVRERMINGMLEGNKTPESFFNRSVAQKEAQNKPEAIKVKKHTMLDNWGDSEWKQQQIKLLTEARNKPEVTEKIADAHRKLWEDPVFRQSQIELRNNPITKQSQRNAKIGTNNPRCDMTKFHFQHSSGVSECLTKYEFRTKYNISLHFLGKILDGKTIKDWTLFKQDDTYQP